MARKPSAPRSYRSTVRDDARAETRRRIVAATVALHAERGMLDTRHADIAERAGVSVPTVYNHFPTAASLLPHCMGSVEATLPPLDPGILTEPDAHRRIARLVAALHDRHERLAPWLRWSVVEAARVPELAAALTRMEAEQAKLVAAALAPGARRKPAREHLAIASTLLHFTAWQRLLADLGDTQSATRATIAALQRLFPPDDKGASR